VTTTLAHIDALRDVFTEITQDCLLLDLAPCTVRVNAKAGGGFDSWVQFSGTDSRSVDVLADLWGFEPGRLIGHAPGQTYIRAGRFDLNGRAVEVQVFSGHPGGPLLPVGYAPQAVQA
jgi:hypothetical protein